MKHFFTNKGFSLVEMLVYTAVLSIILISLVNTVFSFSHSYRELSALRAVETTALASMERMVRDIHLASSIDTAQSTLGTSPGVLTVLTASSTTKFFLTNGVLHVSVGGTDLGPLSVGSAKITSLVFKNITNTKTQAVKINMTVQGVIGPSTKIKNYQTTVILKNS